MKKMKNINDDKITQNDIQDVLRYIKFCITNKSQIYEYVDFIFLSYFYLNKDKDSLFKAIKKADINCCVDLATVEAQNILSDKTDLINKIAIDYRNIKDGTFVIDEVIIISMQKFLKEVLRSENKKQFANNNFYKFIDSYVASIDSMVKESNVAARKKQYKNSNLTNSELDRICNLTSKENMLYLAKHFSIVLEFASTGTFVRGSLLELD